MARISNGTRRNHRLARDCLSVTWGRDSVRVSRSSTERFSMAIHGSFCPRSSLRSLSRCRYSTVVGGESAYCSKLWTAASRSSRENSLVQQQASRRWDLCQGCQETLMNILKAAVGHDQDDVRWLGIAVEVGNNLCARWVKPGANPVCLQRLDQCRGREACLWR